MKRLRLLVRCYPLTKRTRKRNRGLEMFVFRNISTIDLVYETFYWIRSWSMFPDCRACKSTFTQQNCHYETRTDNGIRNVCECITKVTKVGESFRMKDLRHNFKKYIWNCDAINFIKANPSRKRKVVFCSCLQSCAKYLNQIQNITQRGHSKWSLSHCEQTLLNYMISKIYILRFGFA